MLFGHILRGMVGVAVLSGAVAAALPAIAGESAAPACLDGGVL